MTRLDWAEGCGRVVRRDERAKFVYSGGDDPLCVYIRSQLLGSEAAKGPQIGIWDAYIEEHHSHSYR